VRIRLTAKGAGMREKAKTVRRGVIDACKYSSDELKALNAQLIRLRDGLNEGRGD
jgi:hypothetical protein